jgi:hypothetical protein
MMALLLLLNFYIALRFGKISDFQAGYQKFYQCNANFESNYNFLIPQMHAIVIPL